MNLAVAAILAALSGFISISVEILWVRLHSFATRGAANSFGDLLGAYLLGIACGSFLARRFCGRIDTEEQRRQALRAVAGFLLAANLAAFFTAPLVAEIARHADPSLGLFVYAAVAALLGTSLPLLAHFGIPPDEESGRRLARIYLANLVGCTAGSLLTGFVLLDVLPFQRIAGLLAAGGAAVSLGTWLLSSTPSLPRIAGATALAIVLGFGFLHFSPALHAALFEKLQYKSAWREGLHFLDLIENRGGVITVTQEGAVFGGGAYDGHFNVDPVGDINEIARAYAIATLHPAPQRVLMIGVGSGAWAQVVAHHPALTHLTAVDINPGYFELLGRHDLTRSLLGNDKVRLVVDDGRRWLRRHDERFDLIVQNTTHNWRAHITNLVSKEYLELIRDHLAPGGVYWSNTTRNASIQRTAAETFAEARRFRSFLAVSDRPFDVARADAEATLHRWTIDGRPAFDAANPKTAERIAEILGAGDFEDRAAILARTRAVRTITDDNMATEWWLFR